MSKSACLRRIQADIRELAIDPSDQYYAAPLESDMLEWHFTIRGADETDFAGGWYHGRILLPPDYPFNPPHILFLTPSGRFATNTKVCLSFTAWHKELWVPAWGIRLILEALISFLPTPADGAIGALSYGAAERQRLASKSLEFVCPCCGKITDIVEKIQATAAAAKEKSGGGDNSSSKRRFQKEIEMLQMMQQRDHKVDGDEGAGAEGATEEQQQATVKSGQPAEGASAARDNVAQSPPASDTSALGDKERTTIDKAKGDENEEKEKPAPAAPHPPVEEPDGERRWVFAEQQRRLRGPAAVVPPNNHAAPFWLSDPILNSIIFVLASYLCFLFVRFSELVEEMPELDG